ncbi:MAG: autotransporter assembly complex protein TamA [bacterium]
MRDRGLRNLLEGVSSTIARRKIPAASLNLLRKRAERDIPGLVKALKSQGYFGGSVSVEVDAGAKPAAVIFRITPGPPFLLESVDIRLGDEGAAFDRTLPGPREIGLVPGERAHSKAILDAQKYLIHRLMTKGYPFAAVSRREVVADHATQRVSVRFLVDPGPVAWFGPTRIEGLHSVDETFVRGRIPWEVGDRYNEALVAGLQNRLVETGLFAVVNVRKGETLTGEGRLPVAVTVKERKHRTIKAGVKYTTDEGAGAGLSWEHRNLFGRGERLSLGVEATEIDHSVEGTFRKPAFFHPDRTLILRGGIAEEYPDAYTSRAARGEALVEQRFSRGVKVGGGAAVRTSQVIQFDRREGFNLVYLPVYLDWDTSNDILDPARGGRLTFQVAPYYDVYGADLGFVKGDLRYSRYATIARHPMTVFAGRMAFGAVDGAGREAIPADIRFYAGGGGSIRGYAFQSVGPLAYGEPIGGRSLIEISAEVRVKVTDTVGLVTFLDGGSAFSETVPHFEEDLRWGTGVGVRYYTPVGPLRLDVGVPLNRREGVDRRLHIYISLGQAF